jgi:hypothetical protein
MATVITPPASFSYSGLGTADKCLKLYELQYIQKIVPYVTTFPQEQGTVVHSCLEALYLGKAKTALEAFDKVVWPAYLAKYRLEFLAEDLTSYAESMEGLHLKASADYDGDDAIRTQAGGYTKKPTTTAAWKDALAQIDTDTIDNQAFIIDRRFREIPVSKLFYDVRTIVKTYNHPEWYSHVEPGMIEVGFSVPPDGDRHSTEILNPVRWPSHPRIYMKGFIDLACRTHKGGLVLMDHKTSAGEAPTETHVQHHGQLNLYAWVWHYLTDEWPEHIAINHIKTGKAVIADLIPSIAEETVKEKEALIGLILQGHFYKRNPTDYQSPCLKCPMLINCWPRYGLEI